MELGEVLPSMPVAAASFDLVSEMLDREWIALALAATGSASLRRPNVPGEYVIWIA